jgi:hypothetical protein
MATKKNTTEEEYKAVTLTYKWMFVDMVNEEDTSKSYLGISIIHTKGWTKPRPITMVAAICSQQFLGALFSPNISH